LNIQAGHRVKRCPALDPKFNNSNFITTKIKIMKTKTSSLKNIGGLNRSLMLASLIALFGCLSPNHLYAGWVWPWRGGALEDQVEQSHNAQIDSDSRAALIQHYAVIDSRHAHHVYFLTCLAGLFSSGVIVYLIKTRKVIQQVVKNEIVEKVVKNEIVQKVVQEVVIFRSPAHDLVTDAVVIDGTNIICGTPSYQNPSLLNLLGLLLELQKRNCVFKCFFDASTLRHLKRARRKDEAYAYRRLCFDFPDLFVEVAEGNQADDFILDYAHSHGTPIISNDLFRDYEEKYGWLKSDIKRRVSFLIHSGMFQIVPMGIQAAIPIDLVAADSSFRAGFGKPVSAKALVEINRTNNHAHTNGHAVLAAA
jgi:hypothetical protein